MRVTPPNITSLAPNEVFTYGSNAAGRHGSGAAKTALQWGAVYGRDGFAGQTYGISTKDEHIQTLPLHEVALEVAAFIGFAIMHPDLHFLVTAIGCGLAGYAPADIAPMFRDIPANVSLPQSFWDVLNA